MEVETGLSLALARPHLTQDRAVVGDGGRIKVLQTTPLTSLDLTHGTSQRLVSLFRNI